MVSFCSRGVCPLDWLHVIPQRIGSDFHILSIPICELSCSRSGLIRVCLVASEKLRFAARSCFAGPDPGSGGAKMEKRGRGSRRKFIVWVKLLFGAAPERKSAPQTDPQLRNLIWTTSKHDVYLMQNYSVMHWSSLLRKGREVFNVAGLVVPTLDCHASVAHPLTNVQISTMAVRDNLVVAGGFQGELICKYLNRPGVSFCTRLTPDDNSITNAVDIYRTSIGSLRVSASNNDCYVRIFDTENFTQLSCLSFLWSVNNTSVSPDGKLLAVLGDSTECLLADAQSGKVIGSLKGHLDYSFASAWHPDSNILATGNQDRTCRLWDVRKFSESVAVFKGRMGAIRGIKFSADGRFMAMAEPADFIHILDVNADYSKSQEIDLFGEIAGISFSPDSEALFVGIADRNYGSLVEFRRRHPYQYLDSFL